MDDFTCQENELSPLEYSKRKQPKYQLQNWTHFHIIFDGIVESPISALSFILRQKIFWRRMHRPASGTPVLRIVAKSSGDARLDLVLSTLPSQFCLSRVNQPFE